jgi:predicted methyltransferase
VLVGAPAINAQPVDYPAIVAAEDRTDADRQIDQRRDPVKLLAFTGVQRGFTVVDMGAGGGYSTELMARAVGPTGKVYAQDSATPNERAKAAYDARAQRPAMANVVRMLRAYDDPIATEAGTVDLITFFFAYHDVTFMPVDRAAMNRKMFAALKPGGVLIVADHSARTGDGTSVASTLHRIEEAIVKTDLAAAGFRLVAEGDFLRNPDDPRTGVVFRSPVRVDEFVLKFEKPR